MGQPRRILVVRTDRLGDVVLATPLVRALRRRFPDAYLAALVRPYARDVLAGNPHLDEILVDDRDGEHHGWRGFVRAVSMLRRRRFDTALLLLPTSRAAYLLFAAGIRRRIGVGRKFYEVVTFMQSVSRGKYIPLRHEADYCLDLGRRIGASSDDLATEIVLSQAERAAAGAALRAAGARQGERLVGIHPGHGGSSPNWETARYFELAQRLVQEPGVRVILTGEERTPQQPVSTSILDLRGRRPLRELIGILSQLDVLVSSSTGPMHMAAALGVPTVSLFCPLPACSPQLWGPKGNRARVVLPPQGYCQDRCARDPKRCTLDAIEVERVAGEVESELRSGAMR